MDQLTVSDLFRLTPWRQPTMDFSINAGLIWNHPPTGREYFLGESHVALEGTGMRLLVRPPSSDDYVVIKIKGFLRQRLITEATAPSKTEINGGLNEYMDLGVIESGFKVP